MSEHQKLSPARLAECLFAVATLRPDMAKVLREHISAVEEGARQEVDAIAAANLEEQRAAHVLRKRLELALDEGAVALADNAALVKWLVFPESFGTSKCGVRGCEREAIPVLKMVEIGGAAHSVCATCYQLILWAHWVNGPASAGRPGHPGAALLEERRKALVRARNAGLEKAATMAQT